MSSPNTALSCFEVFHHTIPMKRAFTTYIRPYFEDNSNIWNPTKKYSVDELENIQRHFSLREFLPSLTHFKFYLDRLKLWSWGALNSPSFSTTNVSQSYLKPTSYFHLLNYPPSRNSAVFLQKSCNSNHSLPSIDSSSDNWTDEVRCFSQWNSCLNSLPLFKRGIESFDFIRYSLYQINLFHLLYRTGAEAAVKTTFFHPV